MGIDEMNRTSWALLSWVNIPDRNDPSKTYLRRLRIIRTPWFALYLHFIFLPDTDRDPHDHPWNFASFVIRGGYTERLYDRLGIGDADLREKAMFIGERRHSRLSFHRVKLINYHKIVSVEPNLVTLVFIGREKKEWGFWDERAGKWVAHQDYDRNSTDAFA